MAFQVHEADDEMIRILTEEHGRGRFDAVLHCFSSGRRLAEVGAALREPAATLAARVEEVAAGWRPPL